jgi:hypothetical protein
MPQQHYSLGAAVFPEELCEWQKMQNKKFEHQLLILVAFVCLGT